MTITQDTRERFAVSCLIGYCEGLVAANPPVLTEQSEASLRALIAQTLAAFKMPSKHERAANNNRAPDADLHSLFDPSFEETMAILRAQMGATL